MEIAVKALMDACLPRLQHTLFRTNLITYAPVTNPCNTAHDLVRSCLEKFVRLKPQRIPPTLLVRSAV